MISEIWLYSLRCLSNFNKIIVILDCMVIIVIEKGCRL